MQVWTSTLQRTIETAGSLNYPKLAWKSLDELDAGVCDGMKYEEIAVRSNTAVSELTVAKFCRFLGGLPRRFRCQRRG